MGIGMVVEDSELLASGTLINPGPTTHNTSERWSLGVVEKVLFCHSVASS
jgi:hypothetical protein